MLDDILVAVENRRKTAVENSSDSRFNGAAIDITLPSAARRRPPGGSKLETAGSYLSG
jgi:hypothetical protein